jgi:hypothetical protein
MKLLVVSAVTGRGGGPACGPSPRCDDSCASAVSPASPYTLQQREHDVRDTVDRLVGLACGDAWIVVQICGRAAPGNRWASVIVKSCRSRTATCIPSASASSPSARTRSPRCASSIPGTRLTRSCSAAQQSTTRGGRSPGRRCQRSLQWQETIPRASMQPASGPGPGHATRWHRPAARHANPPGDGRHGRDDRASALDKDKAAPTWKKTYGFDPLTVFADHGPDGSGKPLAILLRPGNPAPPTTWSPSRVRTPTLRSGTTTLRTARWRG